MPPSTSNNFIFSSLFSSLWSKSDSQLYCVVFEAADADVNNSEIFRSVLHYSTISHPAAAVSGPEVHRECPMTYFPALLLLATNPGDATDNHLSQLEFTM